MNQAILQVRLMRPKMTLKVEHVPGKLNVSDDLSRGKAPVEDTREHAVAVRAQAMGVGLSLGVSEGGAPLPMVKK